MKKKIFAGAILSSFFVLALGNIFASINFNQESYDEVINEEELFDNQFAHTLDSKNALANDELLENNEIYKDIYYSQLKANGGEDYAK